MTDGTVREGFLPNRPNHFIRLEIRTVRIAVRIVRIGIRINAWQFVGFGLVDVYAWAVMYA